MLIKKSVVSETVSHQNGILIAKKKKNVLKNVWKCEYFKGIGVVTNMKIQSEQNVSGRANKIRCAIRKKNNFIFLMIFLLLSCTNGTGIYDDRLIKLGDAEKDLAILFIAKQIEYFPGSTIIADINLSSYSYCDRDVYYDKSDFRRCISNLAVHPFASKNNIDLGLEFLFYMDSVCDLKKIIMFENSSWGGEINLCELN